LDCYNNGLTSLNGIENLTQLQYLYCGNNELTSLNRIENLTQLKELSCSQNRLTSLNGIENLTQLREVLFGENEITHIPPNIQRILNGQKSGQDIYRDSQNVHNHSIQESIKQSINNILQIEPIIKNVNELILNDPILTPQTKQVLVEYSNCTDVHTVLNITFGELLIYVFNRIEINEHKDEIKKILNTEMADSICKCFTGRISRLINCLNGFDSLVDIKIADNEQISQIIIAVKNRLANYSVSEHQLMAEKELLEMGYSKDIIDIWIQNIE
jgi:Leucine-rich repeat (LRR) protein